jgi:hypothetical protein
MVIDFAVADVFFGADGVASDVTPSACTRPEGRVAGAAVTPAPPGYAAGDNQ